MKQYRQDSHVLPLVFWALLCVAVAIFLFFQSHKIISRTLRIEEIAAGVGFLILGPAALVVYLIRARSLWVALDPERGILLQGKHLIPWEELKRVERRRPRLRKSSGPAKIADHDWLTPPAGCGDPGCSGCIDVSGLGEAFAVVGLVLAVLVALWFVLFVFIPLLVVPLLEIFAPFGDRITITSDRGKLVLRDMAEADEFVRLISARMRVEER
ncbi:MAG TPA: hypothetical protein VEN81_05525 [Planctomycetota bacterium]|nr:hypothetical protein [Planctomycetota bacterium]